MNPYDPRVLAHLVDREGSESANDDHGPMFRRHDSPPAAAATSGWNPFDVWRTRVRDARRDALAP